MCVMKLSFDDLDGLLWQLTFRLWDGKITLKTYVRDWDELVAFAGWSESDFLQELDERWTAQRKPSVVFLC